MVPRFFLDPNVRFPEKPVLADGLLVRDVPRGLGIEMRGGPRRFILRGRKVTETFAFLRPLLDGRHSLPEILEAASGTVDVDVLCEALEILHRNGVLRDGPDLDGDRRWSGDQGAHATDPRVADRRFWARNLSYTRSASTVSELDRRLADCRVTAVVNGLAGYLTIELLGRCGVPTLNQLIIDGSTVRCDLNAACVELVDAAHGLQTFLSILSREAIAADLLVVVLHGAGRRLRDALNVLALESRVPLLFADDDGERGNVIFVDPHRSACLACRDWRRDLTSEFALEDYLFQADTDAEGRWLPNEYPAGESIVASALIAAHVAGEAVRFAGAAAPLSFVNASLEVELLTGRTRLNPVLRVPRCPACSQARLSAALESSGAWSR